MSNLNQYEDEVRERWGNTEAYRQSKERTSRYSQSEFQAARKDQEAATELFVMAFGNHHSHTSVEAQAAVVAHRDAISKWFYDCSIEMQKNLATMYLSDPRFKEYYEGRVRGLAQYVHDAIIAQ